MSLILGWLPQPIGGMKVIQQEFFDSVLRFMSYDADHRKLFVGYVYASNSYIPAGRNQLVRSFLDTGADHLLMLDWDVTFQPEDVYSAIDATQDEWDVVGGTYVTWFGEDNVLRPCWFIEEDGREFVPAPEFRGGEVVPLTVVGMGFTLMSRELILRMEKAMGDDPWPWFGHDVINTDRVGEDLTFSTRARRVGAKLWGHGGIQLGHTKAKTLYPEDMADQGLMTSDRRARTAKLLDVGGGAVKQPLPTRYQGMRHINLDIADGPGVDVVKDAREMDFDAEFDVVWCCHNIEHYEVHEVGQVLRGMHRALRPGGKVDIQCPNFEEVFRRIDGGAGLGDHAYTSQAGPIRYGDIVFGWEREIEESGRPYYMHRTAITPAFLRQQLEEAGFGDIEIVAQGFELTATARKREKEREKED